ncbi:dihydrofolate reductase family protein [Nocardioides speluncae]|uniref:dihydrofolate reductase family protein n=1 Tax=Nocardioides speluncae TaxID=2670337 RepID=UPI000D69C72B|nr:dihydrofolate reductase family protein [Nocardioides speluncae]
MNTAKGKVTTGASVSLDGYIAGPGESGFEHLFAYMGSGDIEVPTANPNIPVRMTADNAAYQRALVDRVGAIVVGRHLYDMTSGWGGIHPMGCPVVVLTHNPPAEPASDQFTFVTGGIEEAIETAHRLAGGKEVGLNAGQIAQQALAAGLLDEIHLSLVPVYLGGGKSFFPDLAEDAPLLLDGPEVIPGTGVTYLHYRVRRP